MVVDSSALVALLAGEPEAGAVRAALETAPERLLSAVNLFETRTVLHRRFGARMVELLEGLIADFDVTIAPFDTNQAALAFATYRRFGKGSGHPARLNLGDCAAYALATSLDLPLLYKGRDFARIGVAPVLS